MYIHGNGFKSKTFYATFGIPQGLDPMLFLPFINGFICTMDYRKCEFANNLKVFLSISAFDNCVELQRKQWCNSN